MVDKKQKHKKVWEKMISYYELLTMIKNGEIPKKIEVTLCSYSMTYVPEYDGDVFAFYKIENMEEID